jgi:hypothetical protein
LRNIIVCRYYNTAKQSASGYTCSASVSVFSGAHRIIRGYSTGAAHNPTLYV